MGNLLYSQNFQDPNKYQIVLRKFRPAYNLRLEHQKPVDESRVIHVMSYNLLADRLASPSIFSHIDKSFLHFSFRGPRILAEIRNQNADVLCLQEVDRVADFYQPNLEALGYKLIHFCRPGLIRNDGVAIAYKHERLTLINQDQINFDDLSNFYPGGGTFRRANQALLCLFEFKPCKKQIVIGSTHLYYNPTGDYIKHAQALYLMQRACQFLKNNDINAPIIIGGDYNSQPISSVMSVLHSEDVESNNEGPSQWRIPVMCDAGASEYYTFTNQLFRRDSADGKLNPLLKNFQSAYNQYEDVPESAPRDFKQPRFTNYSLKFKGSLDHIMHDNKLKVLELLELPQLQDITVDQVLPNRYFPSDHIRIEAKFLIL